MDSFSIMNSDWYCQWIMLLDEQYFWMNNDQMNIASRD